MNSIKTYMKSFNNSMKNQYKAWESYRERLTFEIINDIDQDEKPGNMLIIGAGYLNDLDIKLVKSRAKSLAFLDIDIEAVMWGLNHQHVSFTEVELHSIDLTSFDDQEFFQNFSHLIKTNQQMKHIKAYIKQTVDQMNKYSLSAKINQTYDQIIILPVYTQLIYHQFLSLTSSFRKRVLSIDFDELDRFMLDQMVLIIDQINEQMITLLNLNGKIYVASDMLQIDTHSIDYENLKNHQFDNQVIQAYDEAYIKENGYGLGDYGLLSLENILKHEKDLWLVWPFQNAYHFLVKLMILKKEKNT